MSQQPETKDLTPRRSSVMFEPATPDACRRDYEEGADVRARFDQQIQGGRR
ncbi:hypothetical protein [Streptomyces sp. NPDC048242]|uniref:hypothetical protein n=1 Tax=Streptomyces sp. NPDC048242 TaxID=3155026 RepID=UPI00343E8C6C